MRIARYETSVSILLLASSIFKSDAFSPLTSIRKPKCRAAATSSSISGLNAFFSRSGASYGDEEEENFDVEAAREKLESLAGGVEPYWELAMRRVQHSTIGMRSPSYQQTQQLPSLDDISLPPASPLTTIERERRQAEIHLMAKLSKGDDSVEDIFTLWSNEKGPDSARKLVQAEKLTSDGSDGWKQAENILKGLIVEHGVYFVEPVHRLATLYYMQGRLEEAETLCKIVLRVKPWHFGALSGIVMVYGALSDSHKARLWAASRLPTYAPNGANKRRTAWVEMAVQSATEALELAEDRVHELFGAPDDYVKDKDGGDTDAWQ